jgi:hypothetical protein
MQRWTATQRVAGTLLAALAFAGCGGETPLDQACREISIFRQEVSGGRALGDASTSLAARLEVLSQSEDWKKADSTAQFNLTYYLIGDLKGIARSYNEFGPAYYAPDEYFTLIRLALVEDYC